MTKPVIIVINGNGDDNDYQAIYSNGKYIGDDEINGANDAPDSIADYAGEIGVSLKSLGITSIEQADSEPDAVTQEHCYFRGDDFPKHLTPDDLERIMNDGCLFQDEYDD